VTIAPVSKTMHSTSDESPAVGPHTHVEHGHTYTRGTRTHTHTHREPTNGLLSQECLLQI